MRGRIQYEPADISFPADAYRVTGYDGVAWYVLGWEVEPGEEEMEATGRVVAVMVGDDRRFTFDLDELSPLGEGEYCPDCGQIGCGHA